MIHCYGFLAVFVTALTFRSTHRSQYFYHHMRGLTEQIERLPVMLQLLLFGGALMSGLLTSVGWIEIGVDGRLPRPATGQDVKCGR